MIAVYNFIQISLPHPSFRGVKFILDLYKFSGQVEQKTSFIVQPVRVLTCMESWTRVSISTFWDNLGR